jgi:hypothetical protein
MIFSTLLSKAAPWGDSYPGKLLNDDYGYRENPFTTYFIEYVRPISGLGRQILKAKLSRAK